jgi:hypothetical protein
MSHMFFPKGKALAVGLECGSGSVPSGTLKIAALRLDGTLTDTYVQAVTNVTGSNPQSITSAIGATVTTGDKVVVLGVVGRIGANGSWRATNVDGTHFIPTTMAGQVAKGTGTYTSGGCAINITKAQYFADIDGCVVGTPVALTGSTFTNGVLDAADPTVNVPAGVVSGYVVYLDTGNAATSPLIYFSDGRMLLQIGRTEAASATQISVPALEGPLESGVGMDFTGSGTAQIITTSASVSAGQFAAITVNALSSSASRGDQADVPWTNSVFPLTMGGGGGNLVITLDPGTNYTGEPQGFGEI